MAPNALKILFVGAELDPLVKVGGLADVLGSLPRALSEQGLTIRVIIPFYGSIDPRKYRIKLYRKNIKINLGPKPSFFDLYQCRLPNSRVRVWLLRHRLFADKEIYLGRRHYRRGGRYSRSLGDIERFVFFSKAVLETLRAVRWQPDIMHCHDWHTALIPTFIDEYSLKYDNFANISTLFTIHNLANQGITSLDIVDYASLHHDLTPALMEDYYDQDGTVIDLMKIGILSADYINTVSPTYAREILTKEYGAGLEKYLQRRRRHLAGILNGLDWRFFDPAQDKFIKKNYQVSNLKIGKEINKKFLQTILKLPLAENIPVFAMVSRLVKQKGLDILIPALENFLKKGKIQVVILGTGQWEYEKKLSALAKKYPQKLAAQISFDIKLAQQIYAGSDFFLMPSRFEPCGLGQMIALRYGSIPVVRQTGGLQDTVKNTITGLVFKNYNTGTLIKVIKQAIKLYQRPSSLHKMRFRCMHQDHSWSTSARQYIKIYKKLIK